MKCIFIKLLSFVLLLSNLTISHARNSVYTWLDFSQHSPSFYKYYPCGINAMYYLIHRLGWSGTINEKQKENILSIPEIASFSEMQTVSESIGLSLKGYQVDFNKIQDYKLMVALFNGENIENHYVVVEKNNGGDKWIVTDWPFTRYILSADELNRKTNGYVLVPTDTEIKPHSGPFLVVEQNPVNIGEHVLDKTFDVELDLFNYGDEPLLIHDIQSTCQCVVPDDMHIHILPGESQRLPVNVSTTSKIGSWNEYITFVTNDSYFSPSMLALHGNGRALWEVSTDKVIFQHDSLFDQNEKTLDFHIDFFTDEKFLQDDFIIIIESDSYYHYRFEAEIAKFTSSGLSKKLSYTLTLYTDMIVPMILDGVIIINHKKKEPRQKNLWVNFGSGKSPSV